MTGVNDFVVKFANVNGSGSASANSFFAKALFRMGLPVSPKNIFPSNIQGLPTWFEVRISEAGHLARREGVDIMVAMNPQTYAQDVEEVVSGGYLIYDSTREREFGRDDINVLGIPIARLCAFAFDDPRHRQLFKNIVYVGALAGLVGIEISVIEQIIFEQFKSKEHLNDANLKALHIGLDYSLEKFKCPLPLHVRQSDAATGKIMISGNDAAGLGCIYAGATVAAWYPHNAFNVACRSVRALSQHIPHR